MNRRMFLRHSALVPLAGAAVLLLREQPEQAPSTDVTVDGEFVVRIPLEYIPEDGQYHMVGFEMRASRPQRIDLDGLAVKSWAAEEGAWG